MKTENLERYLNSFGKYMVQQSRTNLTKGKKNVDKWSIFRKFWIICALNSAKVPGIDRK